MPPGVTFCHWCGTGVVTPSAEATPLSCPCGAGPLEQRVIPLPEGTVGRALFLADCATCHGLWVGRDTVERLVASHADDAILLALVPGIGATSAPRARSAGMTAVRYRACPECATIMNRVNFARISGVILDVCRSHGAWFDAHELPAVLEFVRRGGLDVARSREAAALAEERRRLEWERRLRGPVESPSLDAGRRRDARPTGFFSLLGELLSGS